MPTFETKMLHVVSNLCTAHKMHLVSKMISKNQASTPSLKIKGIYCTCKGSFDRQKELKVNACCSQKAWIGRVFWVIRAQDEYDEFKANIQEGFVLVS